MTDEILYQKLTGSIIGACMEVHKELGFGFLENIYEKALLIVLREIRIEFSEAVSLRCKIQRSCYW